MKKARCTGTLLFCFGLCLESAAAVILAGVGGIVVSALAAAVAADEKQCGESQETQAGELHGGLCKEVHEVVVCR